MTAVVMALTAARDAVPITQPTTFPLVE